MYGEETVEEGRRPPTHVKKMAELNRKRNENKNKEENSYNIKTTDNPKGGLRDKNNEKTYPSGVGSGG